MKIAGISSCAAVLTLLLFGVAGQAATFKGTVTNKTTNRPSAGDTVALVDVQAGMADAATATTDSNGRYELEAAGVGPYLIRVTHQGASYFIAAPQSGGEGNLTVYDVVAKVDGVAIHADMLLVEAAGGMLRVHERYLVRNTSLPPKAQFSSNTFEVAIPPDAEIDGASATRPGGLATNTHLLPLSDKGRYSFNIPIQPDQDEKETLFELQYHVSYTGQYRFTPQLLMPADRLVVYVAKGIAFKPSPGSVFQSTQEDPRVQTFVTSNPRPGQAIGFSISGEGQMPPEAQNAGIAQQGGMGDAGTNGIGNGPGGGLGAPIDTPDPFSRNKWWIVALLTLLLLATSAFMLRRRGQAAVTGFATGYHSEAMSPATSTTARPNVRSAASAPAHTPTPSSTSDALLNLLKEEMFAIEQEKLSGTLSPQEYAKVKIGLEALLRRVLRAQQSGSAENG
jgi:hypothetical protein